MYYTIYKITNLVNKKYYIGAHITNDLNDKYMGSGKILKFAINKYGLDNFKKENLHIFDNGTNMFKKEKELVNINDPLSYNIHEGGKGGWSEINKKGLNRSGKQEEKSREALSNKWKNDKEYSNKMKKISSDVCSKLWKEGKMNTKGSGLKKITKEHKDKIGKANKGKVPWNKGLRYSRKK